jgi:hypothetical protein
VLISSTSDWARFGVGQPSTDPGGFKPDCKPLTHVSHVAHVDVALDILRDGKIKSGLVYDESKLNKKRILVTWLSPNYWAGGFRYGNIEFKFRWEDLAKGKNYYWVEYKAYRPPACRILITNQDYGADLATYDPTLGDSPWWYDESDDQHYWNGKVCLEVMVEQDVLIADAAEIGFVDHHERFCCIDAQNCPDLDLRRYRAGALFVAGVIGRQLNPPSMKLTVAHDGLIEPSSNLGLAWSRLSEELSEDGIKYRGVVGLKDEAALSVARAILAAFSQGNHLDRQKLAGLFASEDDMLDSCAELVKDSFALSDLKALNRYSTRR